MTMHGGKYKTFNIYENTPTALFEVLDKEFRFNFDPCPANPCFDGLEVEWKGNVYVNPPYGKAIRIWLEKALKELKSGNCKTCVFLLPSYTDVKWFHEVVLTHAKEIRFIKGRIKFGDHKETAPFGSILAVFQN